MAAAAQAGAIGEHGRLQTLGPGMIAAEFRAAGHLNIQVGIARAIAGNQLLADLRPARVRQRRRHADSAEAAIQPFQMLAQAKGARARTPAPPRRRRRQKEKRDPEATPSPPRAAGTRRSGSRSAAGRSYEPQVNGVDEPPPPAAGGHRRAKGAAAACANVWPPANTRKVPTVASMASGAMSRG